MRVKGAEELVFVPIFLFFFFSVCMTRYIDTGSW
jgi:hypothetical protein